MSRRKGEPVVPEAAALWHEYEARERDPEMGKALARADRIHRLVADAGDHEAQRRVLAAALAQWRAEGITAEQEAMKQEARAMVAGLVKQARRDLDAAEQRLIEAFK